MADTTDRVTRLSPCPVLSITAPQPSNPWRGKLLPLLFGGHVKEWLAFK